MKNHEMMIRDIHRKMDAYNLKNEKRKEMTQKITKLTVPVCAAAENAELKLDALRLAGFREDGGLNGRYRLFRPGKMNS